MSSEYEDREFAALAASRLRTLPEMERLCVSLHIMEGMPIPEVAQLLCNPESRIRRWLRDGLRHLRLSLVT